MTDNVRWDRNLNPRGEMLSSIGFSKISLAIDSVSSSPSNVRFSKSVLDLFSERVA